MKKVAFSSKKFTRRIYLWKKNWLWRPGFLL
jgi:hypothetical protein